MVLIKESMGLYTDFYQLSMAQGYFLSGRKNEVTVFDYYFRTNPFNGGFTVFAGLDDFLEVLSSFQFSPSDINFLKELNFDSLFLNYLETFKFSGEIMACSEGEIVFPNEPVLRVEGNIIECQLVESMLLNILNFETLIATKAYRTKMVAGQHIFADFGLRRAQGFGAIHASRAACIGGAVSTSNVLAGKLFGIPVSGTQAHSWIQSFDSELEAFREFAKHNPENTTLLVDTFNTLKSGIPNAIIVAKEMEAAGQRMKAIRLDSGDLAYLSKKARNMLNKAGLSYVKIIASNQLNEYVVKSLIREQDAKIDAFGIGTELITGKADAALDGVYKLAEIEGNPKMKFSENIEKVTLPSKKQVLRFYDEKGMFYRDAILLDGENPEDVSTLYHPVFSGKSTHIEKLYFEPLHTKVVENGQVLFPKREISEIHAYLEKRAAQLPEEHKRFISPHIYKVGISEQLMQLRNELAKQLKRNH